MAPEMWRQKVSLHSDQYALAATYVRARLGRPLFAAPVLIDLANAHVHETPDLDPLPEAEQKVLLRALAKDPDARYPSCQAFANALRAAVFPPPEPPSLPALPATREGRGALWAALGVALACALAVGLVNYFTQNRDDTKQPPADNTNEKEKPNPPVVSPPEKKYASYPAGWQPVEADGSHQIGERHYHARLTRKIGDRELVAHLLSPTNPTDPAPFYMLEHKLTNKAFKTLWDEAAGQAKVKQLLAAKAHLLPGSWHTSESGKPLDLDSPDADLPVLGVTVPEAMIVAEWLGGTLPTHRQWLKASGLLEGNQKDGPAGAPLMPPKLPREELLAWKREQFQKRKLALGLPGPLAVNDSRAAGDVSRWKISQLVTNGAEWLGQPDARPDSRLQLFPTPAGQQFALVMGHSASEDEIDSAGFLRNESPAAYEWDRVDGLFAGFRVVLEPR
jgi:formylglycine-generating enzyme required for sulfatase activity